jgi:hypothetical protein
VSGVNERTLEHVAEERAVRLGVGAEEDHVRTTNHDLTLDRRYGERADELGLAGLRHRP